MAQKVCFVVMGFGQKTDYELGKTYDLDATYEAIIQPAVEDAGLKCIRADEIIHSGSIDTEMYKMLYQADLVIADITTGNVNAVYELGVRHALKPRSTIIMKEQEGRFSFDLNHTSTFQYKHLGEDIGTREAKRAKATLIGLVKVAINNQSTVDSPVYTYLSNLQMPQLSEQEFNKEVEKVEQASDDLHQLLKSGNQSLKGEDFSSASVFFKAANELYKSAKTKSDNPQPSLSDTGIVQKLVLATYKSKQPSELEALEKAKEIALELTPYESNDPETCGLTGAIHKRLWLMKGDNKDLQLAIKQYGRGFEIRRDYYNGENFATCLDYAATVSNNENESIYNRVRAFKVRQSVVEVLDKLVENKNNLSERNDKMWIYASLANCHLAMGNKDLANDHEQSFMAENPLEWQLDTFKKGQEAARESYLAWQNLNS